MPMKCSQVDERIDDYRNGQLDEADKAALDEHLGSCTRCRHLLVELDNLDARLAKVASGTAG